jgi:hypothetical protein
VQLQVVTDDGANTAPAATASTTTSSNSSPDGKPLARGGSKRKSPASRSGSKTDMADKELVLAMGHEDEMRSQVRLALDSSASRES